MSGVGQSVALWSGDGLKPLNGSGTLRGEKLTIAISRRSSFVRSLRVPNAPKAQVAEALRVTAGDYLPLDASEIAFDILLADDVNMEGRAATLGAIRETELVEVNKATKEAGANANRVVPAAFGSLLLARRLGLRDCAVIEMDSGGYCVDIIKDGELKYSRVLKAGLSEAELEKEVKRTFAAAECPPAPVIGAGGANFSFTEQSRPEASATYLADPTLEFHLETPDAIRAREDAVNRKRNTFVYALTALTAILIMDLYMRHSDEVAKVRKLDSVFAKSMKKNTDLLNLEKTKGLDLQSKGTVLKRAFEPAQRLTDVMSIIANDAPTGVWLNGVTLERGKMTVIRGTALKSEQVAAFVSNLAGEARLRDVKLVFANNATIEQKPIVQFSVQAMAVGNLPLSDQAGKAK
ncbi:MAG: PilN domain-containing protein [Armatimonadetes bacterium]|nr:PilN domain-containing protein [Armatimonadota bacterium]